MNLQQWSVSVFLTNVQPSSQTLGMTKLVLKPKPFQRLDFLKSYNQWCFVPLSDRSISFQIMYLHPSVEDCRYVILQQLFAWQAVVTSQERIQSTRYQVKNSTIHYVYAPNRWCCATCFSIENFYIQDMFWEQTKYFTILNTLSQAKCRIWSY